MLSYIHHPPARPAEQLVIWLHGLGADGHDFENVINELELPDTHAVDFLFPHAPIQPITINQGLRMRAWYDIYTGNLMERVDHKGLAASQEALIALIKAQPLTPEKIILAGFSQGGVVALTTTLARQVPVAGVISLSAYLPISPQTPPTSTQFFIAHGTADPLVDWRLGQQAAALCTTPTNPVIWRTYPMEHSVCLQELRDIGNFIKQVFQL